MAVDAQSAREKGLLKVGEAAKFLGVTAETLRNWDRWGRLVPERNPVTGYRYYKQKDLEKFLAKIVADRGATS